MQNYFCIFQQSFIARENKWNNEHNDDFKYLYDILLRIKNKEICGYHFDRKHRIKKVTCNVLAKENRIEKIQRE